MAYCYEYPRPMLTADMMIFYPGIIEPSQILLIQRKHDPFAGMWALPGGFNEMDETLEETARRELLEETGLEIANMRQFKTVSTPGRDPRGRTVTTVFVGIAGTEDLHRAIAGDDAGALRFFELTDLPPLAFDHAEILSDFLKSKRECYLPE